MYYISSVTAVTNITMLQINATLYIMLVYIQAGRLLHL